MLWKYAKEMEKMRAYRDIKRCFRLLFALLNPQKSIFDAITEKSQDDILSRSWFD